MTKKDYIKLAELIRSSSYTPENSTILVLDRECFIGGLCTILHYDNPRFNKERFIEACK